MKTGNIVENVLVSIICPIYNKERYIAETIRSVINQTYSHWELILVDDGSSDTSPLIAQSFLEDKRIKFYNRIDFKMNGSASTCRNIGLEFASGKFVVFLDADDVFKPNCLLNRISYIQKYPDFDFYVFDIERFIGNVTNVVPKRMSQYFEQIQYFTSRNRHRFVVRKFLTYSTLWSICNPIWQKDALVRIGGFNENFHRLQDPELHTRALLEGLRFKFLKYRTRPDVSVRNDADRNSSYSRMQMFDRVVLSIEQYIDTIYPLLEAKKMFHYVKYLDCYLLLIEQITEGYKYNTQIGEESDYYQKRREQFYSNITLPLRKEYLYVRLFYRRLSESKLLRKVRLPALSVFLYKIFV